MFSQKLSLLLNTVFSSFAFLFDCRLKRLLIEMNLNIDLKFVLFNSFTSKNKPRPVKGHGLVYSLLLRYPNN